jgi:hypothetical protein
MRITKLALSAVFCFAACGGDDAPPGVTPSPSCDFNEAADMTNDATAEMTNFTDVGMNGKTICGKIDSGHFDGNQTIDSDSYTITVSGAPILVHFAGDSGAAMLPDFNVRIFDTANTLMFDRSLDSTVADHVAALTNLPPAAYTVVVTASGTADITASVSYKVQFLPDDPMRCPTSTAAADYTESNDGADNTGNDAISVDFSKDPSFATMPGMPEATGLKIAPTTKAHIAGSSGAATAADAYLDRDSYSFTTGDSANEMSIRVNWMGTTADLDYLLFEDGQLTPTEEAETADTSGTEFDTFALKADTKYTLWVGATKASTGLPLAYDVSICGSGFQF